MVPLRGDRLGPLCVRQLRPESAREFRNGLSLKDYDAHAIVGMAQPFTWGIARADYLYSVAYLRAISLTCSRVSRFGGIPGGLQVSRKKPSRPAGAMIQSRSSS